MKEGATPKEMTSDNESSSPPIGECAFKSRAAKPSKKSKRAAMKIITPAPMRFPLKSKAIEIQPESKLQHVKVFGRCFIIFIIRLLSIIVQKVYFAKSC